MSKGKHKLPTKSDKAKGLFKGETAWFSSSVSKRYVSSWCKSGGELADRDSALFLFSEDPAAPDTIKIFCSDAYLDQHVAVIHPSYVKECVQANDRSRIVLLDHSLPPENVQHEVSLRVRPQRGSYGDSDESFTEATQIQQPLEDNSKRVPKKLKTITKNKKKKSPRRNSEKDYYNIADMAKVTGIIEDFVPGENGCEVLMK